MAGQRKTPKPRDEDGKIIPRRKRREKNKSDHAAKHPEEERQKHAARAKVNGPKGLHSNGQPLCNGKTKGGHACGSWASYDDGKCFNHTTHVSDEERRENARLGALAREKKRPKPHDLLRQVIEARPELFMRPFLEALGIRLSFAIDEETGEAYPVVEEVGDGAVIYGVSKDGDVVISRHRDLEAQQRAAERLMDRVYGKPKQTNINIDPSKETYTPEIIPYDKQRQDDVAAILAEATGHGGHAPAVIPARTAAETRAGARVPQGPTQGRTN